MQGRAFRRTIGIDYSGADNPLHRSPKLAVYCADGDDPPQRVGPPRARTVNWNRREIAEWLVAQLREKDKPTLIGIDHSFSFPIPYFQRYNNLLGPRWDDFLNDFQAHWPTDGDDTLVSRIRQGTGRCRAGEANWFRLTDRLSPRTAKSVFQFGVQGQVATSTHAGLPWLRYIRQELARTGPRVHFWPFDGWEIPEGQSAIVEVYPSLWSGRFDRPADRTPDQHDAYSVAGWLSYADRNGCLEQYFNPELTPEEGNRAEVEGWILGVLGFIR